MRLLLVGGTGFLGSYVATRLRGRELAVLVRPSSDRRRLPPGVPVRVADLGDASALRAALRDADTLVYCASMGFGHVPPLLALLRESPVRRAVFVSTTAIFTHLPAASRAPRLAAEAAVRASRLDWTILRPTMIYGAARDRNISRLLRFLRRSPILPVFGSGEALHQPVFVEDLADAVVAALDAPAAVGRAYNLAGAAPCSYVALVRAAAGALGKEVLLPRVPLALGLAAARLPFVPVTREQVLRLAEDKAFDYAEAVRDFGFRTRSFAEGVKLEAAALGLAPIAVQRTARMEPRA